MTDIRKEHPTKYLPYYIESQNLLAEHYTGAPYIAYTSLIPKDIAHAPHRGVDACHTRVSYVYGRETVGMPVIQAK